MNQRFSSDIIKKAIIDIKLIILILCNPFLHAANYAIQHAANKGSSKSGTASSIKNSSEPSLPINFSKLKSWMDVWEFGLNLKESQSY